MAITSEGRGSHEQGRRTDALLLTTKVANGDNPAEERAEARRMPTLGDAFEDYMAANPNRSKRTNELYRYEANRYLGRLASPPSRCHYPQGCRDPLQQHHGRPRLVCGQPRDVASALGLPPALRRPGRAAQSGRSLARRRRQVPPQDEAQDLGPGRGAAVPRGTLTLLGIPSRTPLRGSRGASVETSPPTVSASFATLGTDPLCPPSPSSPSALTTASVSRSMAATKTQAVLSRRRPPLRLPLPASAATQGYETVPGGAGF